MFEDETVTPNGPGAGSRVAAPTLETWGAEELEAYILALRAEIGRAETQVARKHGSRSAADAFFSLGRSPG